MGDCQAAVRQPPDAPSGARRNDYCDRIRTIPLDPSNALSLHHLAADGSDRGHFSINRDVGWTWHGRVGEGGIGYSIMYASTQLQTDYLFALVFVATALGFAFFFLVSFLEWYFLHHWHESALSQEND